MWFRLKRESSEARPVLAGLGAGDGGVIEGFSGAPQLAQRMRELGLVEGAEVRVMRLAPLGDPIQVRCGSFDISVRRAEARMIVMRSVQRRSANGASEGKS